MLRGSSSTSNLLSALNKSNNQNAEEDDDEEYTYTYEDEDEYTDEELEDGDFDTEFVLDLPKDKDKEEKSKDKDDAPTDKKDNDDKKAYSPKVEPEASKNDAVEFSFGFKKNEKPAKKEELPIPPPKSKLKEEEKKTVPTKKDEPPPPKKKEDPLPSPPKKKEEPPLAPAKPARKQPEADSKVPSTLKDKEEKTAPRNRSESPVKRVTVAPDAKKTSQEDNKKPVAVAKDAAPKTRSTSQAPATARKPEPKDNLSKTAESSKSIPDLAKATAPTPPADVFGRQSRINSTPFTGASAAKGRAIWEHKIDTAERAKSIPPPLKRWTMPAAAEKAAEVGGRGPTGRCQSVAPIGMKSVFQQRMASFAKVDSRPIFDKAIIAVKPPPKPNAKPLPPPPPPTPQQQRWNKKLSEANPPAPPRPLLKNPSPAPIPEEKTPVEKPSIPAKAAKPKESLAKKDDKQSAAESQKPAKVKEKENDKAAEPSEKKPVAKTVPPVAAKKAVSAAKKTAVAPKKVPEALKKKDGTAKKPEKEVKKEEYKKEELKKEEARNEVEKAAVKKEVEDQGEVDAKDEEYVDEDEEFTDEDHEEDEDMEAELVFDLNKGKATDDKEGEKVKETEQGKTEDEAIDEEEDEAEEEYEDEDEDEDEEEDEQEGKETADEAQDEGETAEGEEKEEDKENTSPDQVKKKKKKKKRKKRKPKKEPKEKGRPPKRKWIAPPRPPPEVVEMPPDWKSLYQELKEDGLRPVKRYIKKPKEEEIVLPCTIPWEHLAALTTCHQPFGQQRDPKIKIEEGQTKLVQGALKSETLLPLFEENSKHHASQKGFAGFGGHKRNVENVVDHHKYDSDSKLHLSEGVIPKIFLAAAYDQSDMSAFGSLRPNNIKVKYTDSMEFGCAPDSNTFLSRQFQPNSSEKAGSTMIDQRRQIVQLIEGTEMKHSRLSECIIPKIFSTEEITTKTGADFGSFRPTVHESSGGYKMSEDERKLCALVIPYQTANF